MKRSIDSAGEDRSSGSGVAGVDHALELVTRFALMDSAAAPLEVVLSELAKALVERWALHARIELGSVPGAPTSATEASRIGLPARDQDPDLVIPIPTGDGVLGAIALWIDPDDPLQRADQIALTALAAIVASRISQARLRAAAEDQRVAAEQLLATVSHELSSPLAAVLFNVELCVSRVTHSADEVPREWLTTRLKRTRDAVSAVRNLVNGILGVAQIRSGRVTMQLQPVDLSRIVSSCLSRMFDALEWSGCEVRTQIEPDVTGTWDALKVEIIASNLISNAMKYGAERPIEIAVRSHGDQAELVVTDHGPGIRREQQARMFQQFSRDTLNRAPGTGLGLWIANSYVEAHEGKISLTSSEGRGSTFLVTLPRRLRPD